MSKLRISRLDNKRSADWDRFVHSQEAGTFFHLSGWRTVIEEAAGHECIFLYVESEQGDICAVLPLAVMKHILFGKRLVSLPFCVYGGILSTDEKATTLLEQEVLAIASQLNVDYVELRHTTPKLGWQSRDLYYRFRKPISADAEANMKAIPRKQRAMVRKGIKADLHWQIDEQLDDFYGAYECSVRNLGTPVFARAYFRKLREVFADACDILTVTHEGKVVASVMSFYFRDEVLPYYGGGNPSARKLAGNDFMYWSLMCHASERGARIFDYGRSKAGTGAFNFKKYWGFEPEPLAYEYLPVGKSAIPELNPLNPRYRIAIKAWKKIPLPITRVIGPMLSRHLG